MELNKQSADNSKNVRDTYTRVTDILSPYSGLQFVDPQVLANAAARGEYVHRVCAGIISGLEPPQMSEEVQKYVESFFCWFDAKIVLESEKRYWDDQLQITGQIDYLMLYEEGQWIVDLKTSSRKSKTWPLQMAAYYHLVKPIYTDILGVEVVHVNKEGKAPKVYRYTVEELKYYFELFKQCYNVYKYFDLKVKEPSHDD